MSLSEDDQLALNALGLSIYHHVPGMMVEASLWGERLE
jgi:hypothetical protein